MGDALVEFEVLGNRYRVLGAYTKRKRKGIVNFNNIYLGTYLKERAFRIRDDLKKRGILCVLRGRGSRKQLPYINGINKDLRIRDARHIAIYAYAKSLTPKEELAINV